MQVKPASTRRFIGRVAALAALGAAGLATTGAAHADNVFWSVGFSAPGVSVAVADPGHGRVVVAPAAVYGAAPVYGAPVYVQPRPVYVQPAPVYVQPRPVYMQPAPVYVQPAPTMVGYGYGQPRHGQGHGRFRDINRDGIPDFRQDRNHDGIPDWTRR